MKKVAMLVSEFKRIKKSNFLKFLLMEFVLFILAFGSFYTDFVINMKFMLFVIFIVLILIAFILYIKKQQVIKFLENNYEKDTDKIIAVLKRRQNRYLDILDFTNEKLLFSEILRVLSTYKNYRNDGKIGPWEVIYDRAKTKEFYKKLEVAPEISVNISEDVKSLLNELGIDYRKIYGFWHKNEHEIMYPLFGMLINDSQVLKHGLRYQLYRINDNTVIKPYERKLNNDDIIMLHIKVTI